MPVTLSEWVALPESSADDWLVFARSNWIVYQRTKVGVIFDHFEVIEHGACVLFRE